MKKDGYQHSTVWFLVFWNKICITDKRIGVVLKTIDFESITWCGINNNRSNIVGIIADLYTHLPDNLATKSTQRNNSVFVKNQKMAAQRLASTSPIAFDNHNLPENISNSTLSLNTKQYNQTQYNTHHNHNFNNQNSTSLNNQHNLNNQYNSSSTPRSRINNKKQTFSNNSGSLAYPQHQSSLVQSQHLSSSTPNLIEKRRNLSVCFLLKFNGRNDGNTILRTLKKQLAEYHARKNESDIEVTSNSRSTIANTLHNTVNVAEIKRSASQVKIAEMAKIHALNAQTAHDLLETQNTLSFEPSVRQPMTNSNFNPMFEVSSPSTIQTLPNHNKPCPTPQIQISGPSTTASKTTIQHQTSHDQSSSIVAPSQVHSQHSSQNLMLHEQIMSLSSVVSDLQKEIANLRHNKTESHQSTSQDGGVSQTSEYHEVSPPNSQNTSQHSEVARAEAFLAQSSVANQDGGITSSSASMRIANKYAKFTNQSSLETTSSGSLLGNGPIKFDCTPPVANKHQQLVQPLPFKTPPSGRSPNRPRFKRSITNKKETELVTSTE